MTRFDPRSDVEMLDRAECLDLLAGDVIGRVGIVEESGPLVLPVTYRLYDGHVTFQTGPGSKLTASRGSQACFEVDAFDRSSRSGWSVVVRGRLEQIAAFDQRLMEDIEHLAQPWLGTGRPSMVRLVPTIISGRRVRPQGGVATSRS